MLLYTSKSVRQLCTLCYDVCLQHEQPTPPPLLKACRSLQQMTADSAPDTATSGVTLSALQFRVDTPVLCKYDVIHKPEVHVYHNAAQGNRATGIVNIHEKLGEDRTCSSGDRHADRQTDRCHNTPDFIVSSAGNNNNWQNCGPIIIVSHI